jgi:hypothetical protein
VVVGEFWGLNKIRKELVRGSLYKNGLTLHSFSPKERKTSYMKKGKRRNKN